MSDDFKLNPEAEEFTPTGASDESFFDMDEFEISPKKEKSEASTGTDDLPVDFQKNEDLYKKIMASIEDTEKQLLEIENNINQLTAKRDQLVEQAGRKQEELQGKINRIQEIEEEKSKLQKELDEAKNENNRLSTEASATSGNLNEKIKELTAKIEQLENEKAGLTRSGERDFQNLQDLSKKIDGINGRIKKNNDDLKKILDGSWGAPEDGTGSNVPKGNPVPEELAQQENEDLDDLTPDFIKDMTDNDPEQEGGARRIRLPRIYGGVLVPRWRKQRATHIFGKYKRSSLNQLARKYGVVNPAKYRAKKDLSIAMKLLLHYRYGDIKKSSDLKRVAKIVGVNPRKLKTKSALKGAINKRMGGMKMRGGSYFTKELKSGLLKSVRTPLLTGGQGKYLVGGNARVQGKYLVGGSKRTKQRLADIDKQLKRAKKYGDKKTAKLLMKVRKLLQKGGMADVGADSSISMGGIPGAVRPGAAKGGKRKRKSKRKSRKSRRKSKKSRRRSRKKRGGSIKKIKAVAKKALSKKALAAATGAAVGVALVGGKRRKRKSRKSRRKSKKSRRRSRKSRRGGSMKKIKAVARKLTSKKALAAATGAAVGSALVAGKGKRRRKRSRKSRRKSKKSRRKGGKKKH